MINNNIKYLAVLALGLVACEPEFDNPIEDAGTYSSGEADFSNYVALGNSLTAGFADGALYITGQENSFPNILSQQFSKAGGGDFTQPLMSDNVGGFAEDTNTFPPRLVLAFDAEGNPGPERFTGASPSTSISANLGASFNNMGIPGARVYHLDFAGYATLNPYYGRFAQSPTATVVDEAVAQNPTFFSLWIGNNDILGYATSGGIGEDHNETENLDPSTYSVEGYDITNNNVFAGAYSGLVAKLAANNTEGVLLNLPDVSSLPFFTTVPFAPLSPLDPSFGPQIPTLNATYAGLNGAFAFLGVPERSIQFSTTGASPVVIKDESLTDISAQLVPVLTPSLGAAQAAIFAAQYGQARQATAEDLLVLTSSSIIGQLNENRIAELVGFGLTPEQAGQLAVNGVTFPLEDQYVLTPAEQASVEAARTAYNATIEGLATENGLAFYDVASDLAQAANGGIPFSGGVISSDFVTGGGFSLDGVHPTPRAHALVTNGILDAIEAAYGGNLTRVNPADYGTITVSNEVN